MNELYGKYKFMEAQLVKARETLKVKMPDIKKSLDMLRLLKEKHANAESKEMDVNFLVSDNMWARAKVRNEDGNVRLWLGANVLVEYSFEEAATLLDKNLENAKIRLLTTEDDLNFVKDQVTTMEVNMARVYNQNVAETQKGKTS